MTATYYVGDAIEVMSKLPEKSVDLVLTSPPFLALRSYLPADHPDKAKEGGSQSTPGEFIDWLLDVVEACDRVLASHGSLCFELGDTYSGSGGAGGDYGPEGLREGQNTFKAGSPRYREGVRADGKVETHDYGAAVIRNSGGKGWPLAKSLSLIPESFRWAMVYGHNPFTGRKTAPWRLRNVIRWVRPNPPVGALGDKFRPATSELMVFCKAKDRFFDLDAVRTEPLTGYGVAYRRDTSNEDRGGARSGGMFNGVEVNNPAGAPPLDWWNIPPGGYPGAHYAVWPPELLIKPIKAMCPEFVCRVCGEARRPIREHLGRDRYADKPDPKEFGRNLSAAMDEVGIGVDYLAEQVGVTPWMVRHWRAETVTPQVPSLKRWDQIAGILGEVGEWASSMRTVAAEYDTPDRGNRQVKERLSGGALQGDKPKVVQTGLTDCGHDDYRPGVVLDPFAGSGTTGAVATGHGRDAVLIDLDQRNQALALDRIGPFLLEAG